LWGLAGGNGTISSLPCYRFIARSISLRQRLQYHDSGCSDPERFSKKLNLVTLAIAIRSQAIPTTNSHVPSHP
jgi:hypothetical protein